MDIIEHFRGVRVGRLYRFAELLYSILWIGALIGAFGSYWNGFKPELQSTLVLVFALSTTYQQLSIYIHIHKIENLSKEEQFGAMPEFENWLGRVPEQILRALIVIVLLFGVGKIAGVLSHLYWIFPAEHSIRHFLHTIGDEDLQQVIFVYSSSLVFTLIFLWNVHAFAYRRKSMTKKNAENEPSGAATFPSKRYDGFRILLYALSSILAGIFWFAVALDYDWKSVANLFFIMYVTLTALIAILKIEKLYDRLCSFVS